MPATQREIDFAESLEIHHERLILKMQQTIHRIEKARKPDNAEWCKKQISYYEHLIAAFKWSTSLAKRKATKQ